MIQEEFEKRPLATNQSQIVKDGVAFIVEADKYDIRNDHRLLVPFIKNQKIGFVNRDSKVVTSPIYDVFKGEILDTHDVIRVGTRHSYGYMRGNGEITIYDRLKWGVLDAKGNVLIDVRYNVILPSDDQELFTVNDFDYSTFVVNRKGDIIIPKGKFAYIDGFTLGYTRVKVKNDNGDNRYKWGIVNTYGEFVLDPVYDNIWNFYNKKKLLYTTVEIKGQNASKFWLAQRKKCSANESKHSFTDNSFQDYDTDNDVQHYEEYAGTYAQDVAGYSDEAINDAFDGDPDAYWNID